jgi:hypothetical protein
MNKVQDDASISWRKRKKHFFVLSHSGKPIYSRSVFTNSSHKLPLNYCSYISYCCLKFVPSFSISRFTLLFVLGMEMNTSLLGFQQLCKQSFPSLRMGIIVVFVLVNYSLIDYKFILKKNILKYI